MLSKNSSFSSSSYLYFFWNLFLYPRRLCNIVIKITRTIIIIIQQQEIHIINLNPDESLFSDIFSFFVIDASKILFSYLFIHWNVKFGSLFIIIDKSWWHLSYEKYSVVDLIILKCSTSLDFMLLSIIFVG